jgi:hypothetical protein
MFASIEADNMISNKFGDTGMLRAGRQLRYRRLLLPVGSHAARDYRQRSCGTVIQWRKPIHRNVG